MELIRGKKLLKQIFSENWPQFVSEHPALRPAILKNVDKMLKCGTEEMGFHLYQCPECKAEKKVFHTCKSRFCASCGVAQTDIWIERYTTLFANSGYQHIIFHPPSEFRPYFGIGRTSYFNALYTSVNLTLKDWYTREGYLPGIMDVMHNFGRDIKSSPHIHMLITCGGLDPDYSRWVPCNFIPAAYLKKHWKTHFINLMQQCWQQQDLTNIPGSLAHLFDEAYRNNIIAKLMDVTWYVYVGEKLTNAAFTVRYIGRYTKRPAIAESRITTYDGKTVTFNFVDHKTDKLTFHTLPVQEFIGKLIRHIPDENFRIIRYSGFYANRIRGELLPKVFAILGQSYEKAKQHLLSLTSWWRTQIERFTKLDPLTCSVCLVPLALISVAYATRKTDT